MSEGKRKGDSEDDSQTATKKRKTSIIRVPAETAEKQQAKKNESVPFDLKYMLEKSCSKANDKIWMPFASNADFSIRYARHLGYDVLDNGPQDFFTCQQAPPTVTAIVIAAAQLSKKRQVLQKLVQLNLPFIVILPADTVQRDFFVNILKLQTHRWLVELPTKTLFFHSDGIPMPLPRFKTAFFSCRPIQQQNSSETATNNNNSEPTNKSNNTDNEKEETKNETNAAQICPSLRNRNNGSEQEDIASLIDVKLVDYAALRRAAGILICNRSFETTSEKNLGKMISQPKKKRLSKSKPDSGESQQPETKIEPIIAT
jgi:hypothetical protein